MKRKSLPLVLTALIVSAGSWMVGTAATAAEVTKVTICHRTNSNSNPYVEIEPDVSGIINGHDGHDGPVWNPTLKAQHIKWGDIIPPFDYATGNHFDGQNWDEGEAIWKNGCDTDLPPEQLYGSLSLQKVVTGLPLTVTPSSGALPAKFRIQVTCDDETDVIKEFDVVNGPSVAVLIDHIELGSECTVTELDVAGFPSGTLVTYNPGGTGPAVVNIDSESEPTDVIVNNDFTNVLADVVTVPPAVIPVTVTPQFTG